MHPLSRRATLHWWMHTFGSKRPESQTDVSAPLPGAATLRSPLTARCSLPTHLSINAGTEYLPEDNDPYAKGESCKWTLDYRPPHATRCPPRLPTTHRLPSTAYRPTSGPRYDTDCGEDDSIGSRNATEPFAPEAGAWVGQGSSRATFSPACSPDDPFHASLLTSHFIFTLLTRHPAGTHSSVTRFNSWRKTQSFSTTITRSTAPHRLQREPQREG